MLEIKFDEWKEKNNASFSTEGNDTKQLHLKFNHNFYSLEHKNQSKLFELFNEAEYNIKPNTIR